MIACYFHSIIISEHWILKLKATNAIGFVSKLERYGGTYAHTESKSHLSDYLR